MIGTTLNQRFTLEKELGRGGMGAVYRATDQVLGRTVAIKILKDRGNDEIGKRIRLEAQILARLVHENVVRLYDFGETDGTSFLVMEEVDGTSYLKRWRNLTLAERLRVTAQVADALDYAHHQGVVHRDVKPANVLMTATDQPKLSDFGLSLAVGQADESGTIRGTPHYMSPEQARGKRFDHRTDVYSLGVMLYECAAGAVPFQGTSMAVIAQHLNQVPAPPSAKNPAVSPTLDALILQMLEKNPDRRPVSGAAVAQAIREELERELSRQGAPTTQVSPTIVAPAGAGPTTAMVPSPAEPATAVTGPISATAPRAAPPLARGMLDAILAEPLSLSPEERFLCGHYLGYLLGGSRRKGIFLRRPLDPRNADRARLMLAMTAIMLAEGAEGAIARGVELLEARPDVRPSLNPLVVAKYLASRDTPLKRKRFRQVRKRLQEASAYAQRHLTDPNGVLNPGLMPQTLDDLRKVAPERAEVDDVLVARWNRVAEVWRTDAPFRNAVLLYATSGAASDPASFDLWPEVVYPLIERARWQRQFRTRTEAAWDYLCARVLHVPDAGVRLDRAIRASVPVQDVEQLDDELDRFEEEPQLEDEPGTAEPPSRREESPALRLGKAAVSLDELASERAAPEKDLVLLVSPDPHRFLLGDLRDLWREAIAAMRAPGAKPGHRHVPVGPYRLAVIPSVRGRSAGQVAIQGLPNKEIEMLTPSIRMGGSGSKPIVAVWVYEDNSLAITYLDFKGNDVYILWHAPNAHQFNFNDPGALNHMIYNLGMEAPDQLDRALSKRFRPRKPV